MILMQKIINSIRGIEKFIQGIDKKIRWRIGIIISIITVGIPTADFYLSIFSNDKEKIISSIQDNLNEIPLSDFVLRIRLNTNKKEHLLELNSRTEFFISFWQGDKTKQLAHYRCHYENMEVVWHYNINEVKPKLNMLIYNAPQDFGIIICELAQFNNSPVFDKSERLFFEISEFPIDEYNCTVSLENRNNGIRYEAEIEDIGYNKISTKGHINF